MNKIRLPKYKSNRMFANVLSILVILAMAFPMTGGVSAEGEEPGLRAFPDQDRVDGSFWPAGALVYLKINEDEMGSVTADDTGYVEFLLGEYDLKRGDTLTMWSGDITVTYTARQLFVDQFDLDAQTVSGTIDGQMLVHVWTGDAQLYVDSVGDNWLADFSEFGGVLFPGVCGGAEAWGEGPGSTIVDWCIPNPRFSVFPKWEYIEGWGWPLGSEIYLTIDDPATEDNPDFQQNNPMVVTPWNPDDRWVQFNFNGEYDVKAGDLVTMTDGLDPRSHEVRNLDVTAVSADANTVEGTADPGEELHVSPHGYNEIVITSDGNGSWKADFDDIGIDLLPGMDGRSVIRDSFGNETAVDWHIPKPRMVVFPEWEWFDGLDWPDGEVTITVDGKPECATTGNSSNYFFNGPFGDGCDIVTGDLVTFSSGEITQTHQVRNLAVTDVVDETNIVAGTADAGAHIYVWPHATGQQLEADANEEGHWQVDFTGTFDLIPGSDGRSQILDEFGNATAVDWYVAWLPTTFTVNTTDDIDDGLCDEEHCSLREAIRIANERIAADTIVFNIPGTPPFTIQPQSGFSDITDPVTIDATTQPGYEGSPVIELDGTYAGDGTTGLGIWANASTVRGLAINRYSGNGIMVFGSGNTIQGNYIGTDVTGTTTAGPAGTPVEMPAVTVMDACPAYPVGTDIDGFVSESEDPLAPWSGTSVHFKGTDVGCGSPEMLGAASLVYRYRLEFANITPLESITISGAAFNGPDSVLRVLDEDMNVLGQINTFGGNSFVSPYLKLQDVEGTVFYLDEFDTSSHWRYRQNIVINGPIPLGNHGNGVLLVGGASNNQVIDNLIAGNMENGVGIFNSGTTGNVVQENKIGTDSTGTQALGNSASGVGIGDQAYENFIIGNLISGNRSDGVAIFNPGTDGNTLQGNNIGTDIDREAAIPNLGVGVWIGDSASNTIIGGNDASVRNVISGNRRGGVSINDLGTIGTRVTGNYIGTNKNGDVALPNGGDGVYISGSESVIGGSEPGAGNVISGNTSNGISMSSGATGNLIQSNFIGTDVLGTAPLYSTSGPEFGHYELEALPETCPTYDAGTDRDGFISESSDLLAPWSGISVMFMGTDEDKCGVPDTFEDAPLIYRYQLTFDEPTELTSIAVTGAAFNGGALRVLDANRDVLGTAYNFGGNSYQTNYVRLSGVVGQVFFIEEYDYSSDWRYRESIVINGQLPVGNLGSGVNFNNGASNNLVLDNVISGNRSDAVSLYHTGTNANVLQGNYIGTDVTGTAAVPNTSAAIWIGEGASNTIIGGIEEGQGNLVSGNTGDAISINHAETTGTVIQGNFIGTDVTGSATLPNNSNAIVLVSGTHDNLIGGTEPGAGNVISGNFGDGVLLVDGGTSGNSVQHNFIGTDLTGTIALGNWNRGLYIGGGASDNLISGNVISGNGAAGVRLADSGTTGNHIQGNFIGTDITGLNPLGNGYVGVRITDGAANNMIGGTAPGLGNTIAFNGATGIAMSGDGVFGNALLSNLLFLNGDLGIDLGENGVTPNDPLDQDTGPNDLQNFPVIKAVTRIESSVTIQGLLTSIPQTTFRLEFFSNETCDPSVSGEGQIFLGSSTIKTNVAGLAHFAATLPVLLPPGAFVTATATDPVGNTSEFSKCFSPAPGWNQVNEGGFGDPQNIGVTALDVFQDQLYAGSTNWDAGGQVWRLGRDGLWSQVSTAGFGDGPANPMFGDLIVFQGQLYAGTGWGGAPGQMWRSADGTNWQPVTTDGFGNPENIAVSNFVVFKNMLYAGTGTTSTSAQIWRSSTGTSGSWQQVAPDTTEFTGNVTGFAAYKNLLYAAIEPPGGVGAPAQVWRSTNGSDWVTVTSDGFGNVLNESTGGFAEFGGYLYLGTQNQDTGAQLWRTSDGMNWQPVIENGFGDSSNIKIESLRVYDGFLYAATKNLVMGMQVWRSADGTNWEQVIANGFGDSNNMATLWNSATTTYQGQLLIGTWNYAEGGEIWRFTP